MVEKKAQGALEYLLIIGGAILLVAIVIAVVLNMTKESKGMANDKFDDFGRLIDANYVSDKEVNSLKQSERAAMVAFGYQYLYLTYTFKVSQTKLPSEPEILLNYYNNYDVNYIQPSDQDNSELINKYSSLCAKSNCLEFNSLYITNYSDKIDFKKWYFIGWCSVAELNPIAPLKIQNCISSGNPESCLSETCKSVINQSKLTFN